MSKILVVDDEENIVQILKDALVREGYEVEAAYDGHEAVRLAQHSDIDLVLLDYMLPGIDGLEVLKHVRNQSTVPIIMLTAKSEEIDKVLGLEFGADDYITKPFSLREVLARVKAQLRRTQMSGSTENPQDVHILRCGDLEIDFDAFEVKRNGTSLYLTLREFDLLAFLAKNAGQVFSREQLLAEVWDYDYYGDVRTVDVTVRRTREKIEPDSSKYRYIITKRGVGYSFARPEDL
ncbi:MAG: response regulator [Eubacteriales bacterium]|nr:response regulator [Eubacteriales bacterium]